MTELLQPAPLPIRGDGRFRAILDRADGIDGAARYHWPSYPVAIVEAEPRSLMALLPKPPALPTICPETARTMVAMGGGFAASVALVMASGILHKALATAEPEAHPIVITRESPPAFASVSRASAFAVPTLLPMLDTAATLVAELPKPAPAPTVQRTIAVRTVAVAAVPEPKAAASPPHRAPGTSIASAEPEMRLETAVQSEQLVRRQRQRVNRVQPQQPQQEKAPEQAVAAAAPPVVRRESWKYDHMRSALGSAEDKR